MARTGELAYVYAKASGMLAKSYIGANVKKLFGQQRTSELYRRVLGEVPPQVLDHELVAELQRKVMERTIDLYTMIIDVYGGKEAILVQMLKSFDYLNVKEILYAVNAKAATAPRLWNLGNYGEIRTKAYPNLKKMLESSWFAWLSNRQNLSDVAVVENELDRQYYNELWEIARMLPSRDKGAITLIKTEAIFENIVWATRLRVYYDLEIEEIRARMIELKGADAVSDAIKACKFPLDSRTEWASWKYGYLVNPESGELGFRPDPRVIEANAAKKLYALTKRLFHSSPFSITPSVCFFKLKEFEADILKSVAEGLQMNLPEHEILAFLGETE